MSAPAINVLLVEDNPGDARLIREMLTGADPVEFTLEHTDRLATGLSRLAGGGMDALLLDLGLPDSVGFETFVKAYAQAEHVPIIVLTDLRDEALAVRAVQEGAQDYLAKGEIDARLLRRSIRYAIARKRDQRHMHVQAAALSAAVDAIMITDRFGRIEWVNPAFCDLTGYTAAEAEGRNPRELVNSGQHDRAFFKNLWETIQSGRTWRGEIINRRRDGTLYTEQQSITPMRELNGQISHFVAIKRDITERKRDEEEIRQGVMRSARAELEFRALFAANPLPMWIYNLTTLQFLEVNGTAIQRYGYGRDEFLAMTIKDIRPAEDVERLLTGVGQPRGAWKDAGHWRHRLKSGQIIDVDITSHTITFDGQPAALVVAQDITERKKAVEALRTAEERTRFALQGANVGIWDMDYTTGLLQWSETLESHYGLQPGTFGGTFKAFVECIHPDDRAALLETVGKALNSGGDFSVDNRSVWPDGTVRWLRGTGRVFLGASGEPVRAVGISLDVTERRSLEAQFQQAQKMEAVGRLAGGVAHDFNNLLTAILGYCELLLADVGQDDPRAADIREIQKAGTRAAGLTRQLLAFSRKQLIEPSRLDLNAVVAGIRGMLGRLIGEDVKIVVALAPDLAPVLADRGQVEQVIMNLAVNARDAMPKGGTLTIDTANVELDEHYVATHLDVRPGPYVVLTITDTGTGMTPAVRARLFEPFFTTKEPGKGTGLGLATVYGVVARSGGSVGVYSEVGKGTSFKVYLPRADADEVVVETPPPIARPAAGARTVLVVEDEEGLRELAKRLLQRQGYSVLIAADATEALRLFEANPTIDLLLTDVVMPGASGPELTRQLVEQRPDLRVIYMSGYTEEAIVQHGVLKPGIAFLHKPFTSRTLDEKIRQVLER
jgi:two-component system cell cycle sensor histidine kinase/response regulator CckA